MCVRSYLSLDCGIANSRSLSSPLFVNMKSDIASFQSRLSRRRSESCMEVYKVTLGRDPL
jgi:hypothetical protein